MIFQKATAIFAPLLVAMTSQEVIAQHQILQAERPRPYTHRRGLRKEKTPRVLTNHGAKAHEDSAKTPDDETHNPDVGILSDAEGDFVEDEGSRMLARGCDNCCKGSGACLGLRPAASISNSSCNGYYACFGTSATIASGSCNNDYACYITTEGTVIGPNSCNGSDACVGIKSVSIGSNSCNAPSSCFYLRDGSCIGDNQCNEARACRGYMNTCRSETEPPSLSSVPSATPTKPPSLSSVPSATPTEPPSLSSVPSATPTEPPSLSSVPSATPTEPPSLSLVPSATPTELPSLVPSATPTSTFFALCIDTLASLTVVVETFGEETSEEESLEDSEDGQACKVLCGKGVVNRACRKTCNRELAQGVEPNTLCAELDAL